MSVNIGSMLRAFMGNAAPAEGKALELRIGQIVRGILMEMLDNGEALMNINGVSVRARLEAELQAGRGTLLQVQPGSNGASIVLKPLADAADVAPDEALKNVLKQFGLPDQKWSYELLRGLRRDGYALDSDSASFFRAAASARPASAEPAGWAGAADVAFRRGLNPTESTLAALRQTLFGQPLHNELSGFASAFRQWIGEAAGTGAGKLPEWALGLQRLLNEGDRLLAQGSVQLSGDAARSAARGDLPAQAGQAPAAANSVLAESAGRTTFAQAAAPSAVVAQTALSANPALSAQADAAVARMAQGANAASADNGQPLEVAKDPRTSGAAARSPLAEAATGSHRAQANPNAAAPEQAAQASAMQAAAGSVGQAAQRGGDSWIGRFLQWLGTGHEHQLLQAAADTRAMPQPGLQSASPQTHGGEPAPTPQQAGDSLKSALLLLAASDEAPPALREAAQSLANHITGQQLLLSSERQSSQPYSFMTLFVPMKGQEGDTTATVHVQTRRSRKGEWDADNCRLLFDLRMRHLGSTVVDVQVVDRIVSLKLLNDHPVMADLVEQAREELNAGLRDAGFQLLSLKVQAFPVAAQEPATGDPADRLPAQHAASEFASKPYRGVDFRV